jgi:excisionase family DNA binding protein
MQAMAVSTKQAGELLSLSQKTVQRLIRSGRIRAVRAKRRITIPVRALEEFLEIGSMGSLWLVCGASLATGS